MVAASIYVVIEKSKIGVVVVVVGKMFVVDLIQLFLNFLVLFLF
jgi:hypothetical protein